MSFAQIAKDLRNERGLSQMQLSKKLGISAAGIGYLELGKREPTSPTLIAYAKYFDVSVDFLLGINDDFKVKITSEERAAGASEVKQIYVTPKEDEMIYIFREVGKRHGEKAQNAILEMADNLLKL